MEKLFSTIAPYAVPEPPCVDLGVRRLENERLIPQQAVSTITNVDDVETYIRNRELESAAVYLSAFDLPVHERHRVMTELSYMGITAGSLFPGLDGACEELRELNFDL